jgi:gas vesicle protein
MAVKLKPVKEDVSFYTKASMHPWLTGAVLGAAGAAVAALFTAMPRETRTERAMKSARRAADRAWR